MRALSLILILVLARPVLICAQAAKAASQLADHAFTPVAREASEKIAKELLNNLAATTGKRIAEQSSKSLEAQLTKTIGQYGDTVVVLARRVPEATIALANRAPELLPLAANLGDDILRIEARTPGFAEAAAKAFGKDELPRLLKLPEAEMKQVLALSAHTIEPQAAKLLLEGTEKMGSSFLTKISSPQILAGGLSVAAIRAAEGFNKAGEGVKEALQKASPDLVAEKIFGSITELGFPITMVIAALIAAWGGLGLWRKHRAQSGSK